MKIYTFKKGDSLWNICKKELGNATLWREVVKLNDLKEHELGRIKPGFRIKLSIPKLQR